MAKYVIEIPSGIEWIQFYEQNKGGVHGKELKNIGDLTPYIEPNEDEIRQKIEQEVWEFAKKVRLKEFFDDNHNLHSYLDYFEYRDAKAKHEELKKQKDEIHEYDEIISEVPDKKAVIVRIDCWGQWHCINANGSFMVETNQQGYWRKTGRSFPELGDVIKKIGEE